MSPPAILAIGLGVALALVLAALIFAWRTIRKQNQVIESYARRVAWTKGTVKAAATNTVWAWMEHSHTDPRLRHFLIGVIGSIQQALELDDRQMAEAIERMPDPPRRIPTRVQAPPYLAGPEDVIGELRQRAAVIQAEGAREPDVEEGE